jgi:transglutaminase-like putative cysteine protease
LPAIIGSSEIEMLLKIVHRTRYTYDAPPAYALQRVRAVPLAGPTQKVIDWTLEIAGANEEVRYIDHNGNDTRLLSIGLGSGAIELVARGSVETRDTAGVLGMRYGFVPLWLFQRSTTLTEAGPGVRELVASLKPDDSLERLHALTQTIAERVVYETGTTAVTTTAEEALSLGRGVCQDHAHLFLAAARAMGMPARYVSGYLKMDGSDDQVAMHAWAEAHIDGLGWVGFDPANSISPDERYVRVATGLDYREAMPVSGIRTGQAREELAVEITVEQ